MALAHGIPKSRPPVRLQTYAFALGIIAAFLILSHGPLLRLPFFWDEAGQFIPASLDIYRTGAWIPVSTLPNVHPPGLMAYLAASWALFGFSIEGTRLAMLLVAAFGALTAFLLAIELGRGSRGTPAFMALALLCINPLFFSQSMLAQLDMPAMCLSVLALLLFLQGRVRESALACVALVLIKETGIAAPAVFAGWLVFEARTGERRARLALWFLPSFLVLATWLVILHHSTGSWLGNHAFADYNLRYPLNPARVILALLRRIYYLFIGSGHFIGTAALIWAWKRTPLLRTRAWQIAASFVVAQVLLVSFLGGAVLERYLLPALPVLYAAFAIAFQSVPVRFRMAGVGCLLACLLAANFVNPLYPFPFENNLAFADFVQLEQNAASAVELRGGGPVITAFPVTDALRRPDLGFVVKARDVTEIQDFTPPAIAQLSGNPPAMIVVFNRNWDPLGLLTRHALRDFAQKHYGYVPEMRADEIAAALSMHVVGRWKRRGLTMELLARQPL